MKKKCAILLLVLLSFSCVNYDNHKFIGFWVINDLSYKKVSIIDQVGINTLFFKEEGIQLPEIISYKVDNKAKWECFRNGEDQLVLTIDSQNKVFNGAYEVAIGWVEGRFIAKLYSENTVIVLEKVIVSSSYLH